MSAATTCGLRRGAAAAALLLLVTATILQGCTAGVAGGCVHQGRRYAAEAAWTRPGSCVEFTCGSDGAVTTSRCDGFISAPHCYMVRGNASAPYPGCCPHLRCV